MDEMCIIALIGLPGVGKTSFSKLLLEIDSLPFNICYFCYDDFIKTTEENLAHYKEQRERALNSIVSLIEAWKNSELLGKSLMELYSFYKDNKQKRLLFLCDDNHYYGSMRYRLYQIARKFGISYGQIFFNSTVELCLERNALRDEIQRIPKEVVIKMHEKLEIPNVKNNAWELNTFKLVTEDINKEYVSLNLIPFIIQLFANPLKPLELPVKCPTKQSQVHELDLLMRKHIGDVINSVGPNVNKKEMALVFNDIRKGILNECKAMEHFDDKKISRFVKIFQSKVETVMLDKA
ncbi:phosphoseryl tRNA kinase [Musca autumnalis]|uniref:phosphoseryl tRNA kinase n=1 Tax=Musca autumnalis TaxID=221902 RepID=UPI003CEED3EF